MLIHSPNWLGDVVMALPAFRAWRDCHADEPVHILAKRRVAAIWGFVRDVDSVIVLEEGRAGARAAREAIRAATRKLAATPTLFGEIRQPVSGDYLLIPSVSSEKRKYIPMVFLPADVIASNLSLSVPGAPRTRRTTAPCWPPTASRPTRPNPKSSRICSGCTPKPWQITDNG